MTREQSQILPEPDVPSDVSAEENSVPSVDVLTQTLVRHGIALSKSKIRKLDEYCNLLWDWNTRLNLTRHTDHEKFVSRDVVDSLALAEFLRPDERVLDVGTGGGVPGIILAIVRPDLRIELCDSTGKKTLAVSEMVRELRLDIPIWHAKAEAVLAERKKGNRFTTLTVRAVSRMVQLLRMVGPYWDVFDRMLLVKGPKWPEERGESRHYNLLSKLALRCLKTYPTPISEKETIDSVVLQICRKDSFEELEKQIDLHKVEEFDKPKEFRKRSFGKFAGKPGDKPGGKFGNKSGGKSGPKKSEPKPPRNSRKD